jgi:hypothetical protein
MCQNHGVHKDITCSRRWLWGRVESYSWGFSSFEIISTTKALKLANMAPDSILNHDKDSSYILYSDVKSIMLKKGKHFTDTEITVVTGTRKLKFFFNITNFDRCVKILKETIPDRLVVQ